MTWWLTRLPTLAALCAAPFSAVAQSRATPDTGLFARLDSFVAHEVSASGIPGAAIAVVRAGRLVHSRGFGEDGRGHPITADTPFPIGSLTKSFTALLTRQLIEEGRIDPDAPLQRYLPWFRVADSVASTRITVRHLLNQTSGLSRADGMTPILDGSTASIEDLARSVRNLRLNRPVGTRYEYCNLNFVLLGALVERISGRSWSELVRDRVLTILPAEHSHTDLAAAQSDGMTRVHRYIFGIPIAQELPLFVGLAPTGGLVMSANDVARYLAMMLNGGAVPGGQVLSAAGIAQLLSPASPEASAHLESADFTFRYGEGWFVGPFGVASDARWHLGDLSSFAAWMVLLPATNDALVLLINANATLPVGQISSTVSRLPIGAVSLLRGQPQPTGPSIRRAYLAFNVGATLFAFALASFAWWSSRPARSGVFAGAALLVGVLISVAPLALGVSVTTLAAFAPEAAYLGVALILVLTVPTVVHGVRVARRRRGPSSP